jgi:predicted DNA-binding WGR domain protein
MTLLHRRDPERNMARFYAVSIERSLFGDFMLVRQWGRIGSRGRMQSEWFASAAEAAGSGNRLLQTKRNRGYQVVGGDTGSAAAS